MKNTARIKLLLSLIVLIGCGKASGQVLQVNITTDPPTPPYPAATWIWFRCGVVTSLPVSYNWTTYCTSQGSNQVAFTLTNNNNTERYTLNVRSTPTICIDTVVCSAVDSVGNSGEAILRITNVTGAGLWGTSQPLSNNSALIADSAGQIGTIYCHSASQQPHIGRWTSPAGTDITFTSEDAFDVGLQSGSFHSYTTLTTNGFPLSVADQGVYSCQIPDENGIQNTLHIGIYPHGYAGHLQILSVQKVPSPEPFIVINCSTTGLPPTRVYWTREGRELVNNQMYQLSQFPSDRVTSAYSNLLTINQTLQQLRGFYYCEVEGEQTGTNQSSFGPNVTQVQHSFGVYIVGYTESVTCVISSATRIEWLHNGSVVHSGPGPQQTITWLSVNDSIHHNLYTCSGYRNFTIFESHDHTVIVNVPSTAIIISTSAESAPSLGQSLTIRCIVTETVDGLSARPVLQWQNHNGSDIVSGGGVILDGPNSQSTLTTLTLMFSALRTSHAGRYVCRGSLTSPALFSPLVKTEDYNISVQIPTPTVTIFSPTVGTPYAGSRFILHCTIQLSQTVDSPVTFTVLWRRSGVLISNDTRTTVYNVAQNGSHTFLSMLVFSSLSLTQDSSQYTCEASVSASPPSPYITGSLSATSTAYSLTVERPTIVLASKSIGPTPTSTSPTPTPTAVVTPSPIGSSTLIVALTAGGGGTLFICVLVAVFVIMAGTQMRRKRRQEKERMTDIVVSVLKTDSSNCDEVPRIEILPAGSKEYGNSLASGKDPVTRVPSNYLHQMSRNMIIPSHCIRLMDCVGQGEFGVVYRAYLSGWEDESSQIVAVKTLKVISGLSDISELLDESLKMKTFSHPNILNLIGVCVDAGPAPYVVMPYMEKGSLLQYLKKERPHFTVAEGADSELVVATQCKLLPMCLQIAKGMEYLANERFVHRDLATRNCMIDSSGVIKVADFGLSEDIYTKNYFQQGKKDAGVRLPIRWMALESLQDGIFSEKTDVWSFGVTCWEIFSLGRTPYPGVDPFSLVKFLEAGQRLEKPSNTACTDEIYSIILRCWREVAEKRPSFSELVTVITTSLEAIAGYIDFSYLSVVNKEGHPYDHLAEQDEGT